MSRRLVDVVSEMKPVHILPRDFSTIHSNVIDI
jgi:hypothetical protein